jgi:diguanylate cyclase (GGDEF)-like protein
VSGAFFALVATASASVLIAATAMSYVTRLRRRLAAACFDAHHDALTGLANRRALTPALHRAATDRTPFSVAFVDIDHFKSLNDTFGHAAGDAVLRAIADRLRQLDESVALVSRLGGDEFVLLIRGDERQGLIVANRAWSAIAKQPFTFHGNTMTVRTSVGVASHSTGLAVAELLHRADLALFEAKAGRKVHIWCTARRVRVIADSASAYVTSASSRARFQQCLGDLH